MNEVMSETGNPNPAAPDSTTAAADNKNLRNPVPLSKAKLEVNRRNAQLSTGPKTNAGKRRPSRNALKHGILASSLLIREGEGAEDTAEFESFLESLVRDLQPVGALE
jgi:hypothetical protein